MRRSGKSGHSFSLPTVLILGVALTALMVLGRVGGLYPGGWGKSLAAGDIYIPAAAHVSGAAGTDWRTDVEVHNLGTAPATYSVALLRQDTNNSSPQTVQRTLSAGSSERLSDLLLNLFSFSGSASLRISPASSNVIATSRTFNQVTGGTYGQFIGGILEGEAIGFGEEGRIVQLTHSTSSSTGYRTNLGFVNATAMTIALKADFYRADGSFLGSRTYSAGPYMYHQENQVFATVTGGDVADGYVVISTTTSGGAFFAYASVVDNRTGDPVYVPAEVLAASAGPTPTPTRTQSPTPTPTQTPGGVNADLAPYAHTGWDYPVVPSNVTGTTTVGSLSASSTTYVDSAVANYGPDNVSFAVDETIWSLYYDSERVLDIVAPDGGLDFQAGFYLHVDDYPLDDAVTVTGGSHTLGITADPDGLVGETDESNNSWQRSFNWSAKAGVGTGPRVRTLKLDPSLLRLAPIPGWHRSSSETPAAPPRQGGWAGKVQVGEAIYIAASAHVTGAAGTNWRTDAEIHNYGTSVGEFRVDLLKENQNNSSPQTASFFVSAGQCVRLNDLLLGQFGFSGSAALRITPVSGVGLVTSRTYNDTVDGTYGQFIPGVAESEAIGSGEEGRLIQLTHNRALSSGYRTNIGFVNASASSLTVAVELYTSAGVLLGTRTYTLQPYMFKQVNKIFEEVTGGDVADGYAVVYASSGSGELFAYASVVDNATGDPIFVPAVRVPRSGTSPTPTPTQGTGVNVTISPSQVSLAPGDTQQFTANVTGTSNTAVSWSVVEGAEGGNVTSSGFYTAPGVPGTYHVTATSQADPAASATATVNVVATQTGVVWGTVTSTQGSTLGEVQVTVGGQTTESNDQGYFTMAGVPASDRAVVSFVKEGHVDATEITKVVAGSSVFMDAIMAPVDAQTNMPAPQGGTVQSGDGGSVTITGGTIVDQGGTTYPGTAVVAITTFDPSNQQELEAFPGEFEGVTNAGQTVPFVTFGFMDVTVTTPEGNPLQLASGTTATLRIPIPADAQAEAPSTLPQWYFNPADGRWHEEGTFFKSGTAYEGQVGHFSVWNCDVAALRCYIRGRVVDGRGYPVEGARVEFHSHRGGGGYVTSGETSTPASGEFEVPVDANSTMTYWAEKNGVRSEVVGPVPTCENGVIKEIGDIVLAAPVATITLTWGIDPSDLDAHLAVPIAGGWQHVYYWYAGQVLEGVRLDTDDTTSFGPEIFSIFELHEGTYRYSVHHFWGNGTISSSGAQVNLIVDGLGIYTFTPPPGAQDVKDVWRVFDLVSQAGAITDVVTINDFLNNVDAHDDSSFTP